MTTSILKTTFSRSCGVTEEVLEVLEKPSSEAADQTVRVLTKTTYTTDDERLKAHIFPSPFSVAPPREATRLTSKFVYSHDMAVHQRQTVKRPMRISASLANAINIHRHHDGGSGGGPSGPERVASTVGSRPRVVDQCSDIERAIVREINRLRQRPRAYLAELLNRRCEMIGSTMWTRRSGAVRLSEGVRSVDEAIAELQAHVRSNGAAAVASGQSGMGIAPQQRSGFNFLGGPEGGDLELADSDEDGELGEGSLLRGSDDEAAEDAMASVGSPASSHLGEHSVPEPELACGAIDGANQPSFLNLTGNAQRGSSIAPSHGSSMARNGTLHGGLNILSISTGLCLAAADHAADMGPKGLTSHRGTVGESSVRERAERYGVWVDSCYQIMGFGVVDAVDLVTHFILDDAVPGRHHRRLLLDAKFGDIGISVKRHAVFGTVCVIVLAGRFMTFGRREDAVEPSPSFVSEPLTAQEPLGEATTTCPRCLSAVPTNQCAYGPHGRGYHTHCLLCDLCHSTLSDAFYIAKDVHRTTGHMTARTSPRSKVRSADHGESSSRKKATPSPGGTDSAGAAPVAMMGDDDTLELTLCTRCYTAYTTQQCSVCGGDCTIQTPITEASARFTTQGKVCCEECFLNEAASMQAAMKNHRRAKQPL